MKKYYLKSNLIFKTFVLLFSLLFVCQNTYSQVDFCNNILASHVTAGKSYTTICFDCTPRIHNFNYTSYCTAATEADFLYYFHNDFT